MLFGAHVSTAGKVYNAVDRAQHLACETMQIFTSNPRAWRAAPLELEDTHIFKERVKRARISPVVVHAPYLLNLASGVSEVARLSTAMLRDSIERADSLEAEFLVFHVGSAVMSERTDAKQRMITVLKKVFSESFAVNILLENTSGTGSYLGAEFEEIAEILEAVAAPGRLGICLDTCHAFVAGYDLATRDGVDKTLSDFEKIIGLENLKLIHANDSEKPLGSRNDRHQHIGQGYIGEAGFKVLLNDPRLKTLPVIIETPKDGDGDVSNLAVLRRLVRI